MLMAPMMGMPEMNIGAMLGEFTGLGEAVGWGMHVMIGVVLAVIYAAVAARHLPGRCRSATRWSRRVPAPVRTGLQGP